MKNLVLGLIYLSYTFQITDAAIRPEDETYEVEQNEPFTIEWVYDNQASMIIVTWTFKNSTAQTADTVMTKLGGAVAQSEPGIVNIQHEQNGTITLKKVGPEDVGTYKCIVTYSGFPPVTGTATIKLKASTPEPDCCFCMRRCTVHKPAVCIILCILIIVVILGSGIPPGMAFEAIFGIWEDMSKTKRILSFFALLFGLGLYLCDLIRKKCAGSTTTLTVVEGSKVTFSCPFPESVTFPEWRGPPGLTIYTILDDTSGTINSKIPAFNRLQYASNKRDLILSNAVIGDSGDYKCSYTGQGDHTFTLKVIRANCTGGIDLADNGQLLQENPV